MTDLQYLRGLLQTMLVSADLVSPKDIKRGLEILDKMSLTQSEPIKSCFIEADKIHKNLNETI